MALRVLGIAILAAAIGPAGGALGDVAGAGADFTPGPDMGTPRMSHNAIVLPDGRVAVIGGHTTGFVALNTAETFDPSSGTWTGLQMHFFHGIGAVARLADGRWLLAGGEADWGIAPGYSQSEIYDPSSGSFTPTQPMNYARFMNLGARLSSGKVLVVGGWFDYGPSTYGEVFDPDSGSFTLTNAMVTPCAAPIVVPCTDGTALVFAGVPTYSGSVYERVESYSPVTNSFSAVRDTLFAGETGWIPYHGLQYPATIESQRLADGRYVFLAYRAIDQTTSEYRLFTVDPATKEFAALSTNSALPQSHLAALNNPIVDATRGMVYLFASRPGSDPMDVALVSVRLSDGAVTVPSGWFTLPAGQYLEYYTPASVLPDGRILLTGGHSEAGYNTNFTPIANTWLLTPHAVVPPTEPLAPTNLVAAVTGPGLVTLNWADNSTNEQGFVIQRDDGQGWETYATVGANTTALEDDEILPGMLCRYRVLAFNAVGDSGLSNEVTAKGPKGVCSLSAKKLAYGTVKQGVQREKTVTVKNTSKTDALWVSVGEPQPLPGTQEQGFWQFGVTQGMGQSLVPPRGKLIVKVSFMGEMPGAAVAAVVIDTSDPKHLQETVRLSGKVKEQRP